MSSKPAGSLVRGLVSLNYNGSLVNADGAMVGTVYKNGVADGTVAVTVANLSTGVYSYSYTLPLGYSENDDVQCVLTGLIGAGVAFKVLGEHVVVQSSPPSAAAIVAAIVAEAFGTLTLEQHLAGIRAQVPDLYFADVHVNRDDANSKDEWTVAWTKNGVAVTSGITLASLQLIKRADGTDLLAETAMTEVGATGVFKCDATGGARINDGEAVIAIARATIDGDERQRRVVLSRDAEA